MAKENEAKLKELKYLNSKKWETWKNRKTIRIWMERIVSVEKCFKVEEIYKETKKTIQNNRKRKGNEK